ncbi:MAG: PAS domain S-box protein [Deltaproteobacteria bacterium]|nr:PAS domain S-box protein [Deltaproteobacteria bacterium]
MVQRNWQRLWEKLSAAMMEGVVVVDPKGIIQTVNQAMEEITGYSRQELIGQSCALIRCSACFGANQAETRKQCELFQHGEVAPAKCVLAKKDGTLKHVRKSAALILDDDGQILGGVEVFMDISELAAQERLISRLRRELTQEDGFQGMLGKSAVMLHLFSLISSAAPTEAPVLIFGESGAGKELVARAIHNLSPRRQGPHIRVNCKALQESLLEAELFGPGHGGINRADSTRLGHFEAAHGGDLFLDEVADLSLNLQTKLLRVLCENVIEREGGRKPVAVDVRIITATNQDLQQLVAEGRFREDLLYRLKVIPIQVPPLRERREDIPLLAEAFLERTRLKTRKAVTGFSKEALERLLRYDWPGNVRELVNDVEYACMLCPGGDILPEHLPVHLIEKTQPRFRGAAKDRDSSRARDRESLIRALRESGGKMNEAAKSLGISRVTLWKWLKYHKINVKEVL